MQNVLENFLKNYPQVNVNQNFLLAVSGGMDSTVLAELFFRAKWHFSMAHCNFHLRGSDSNRDEQFVRQLAKKYNVPVFVQEFDTLNFAEMQKIGIEEAARKLRYAWFDELMNNNHFDWLVTAHHQDDSIETFLLNLLRGTGLSGLHGILPLRGRLIRPLTTVTRQQIERFANDNQLSHCEDVTNSDIQFTRNNIRSRLVPFLKEIQPQFSYLMGNTIEHLQGVEKIYQKAIQQICNEIVTKKQNSIEIDIEKLLKTESPSTVLFEILSPFGFNSSVIQSITESLTGNSGKIFYSDKFQAIKDRTTLIVSRISNDVSSVFSIEKNQNRVDFPVSLTIDIQQNDDNFILPKSKEIACFDADQLKFPLQLRHWKQGDFFVPFGMKGRKKLSDFFSNNKFSLLDKQQVWLLCSGYDVIWIVGWRMDNRYRVTTETKRVLKMECLNK
ncbi:MAG: tRNA lysidine(34) synthetase TilS [Bacteroidales bacterium]|nr:tRNA lysidine(34) synthetase TilS [Bacteroidales bacterium]